MQKETTEKKQRFIWIAAGIVAVLILLFFINKNSGPDSTVEIMPTGRNASVFIDRARSGSLQPNSLTSYSVAAGNHQVLIAQDGYWPWTDSLTVSDGETEKVAPFLIQQAGKRAIQAPTTITDRLAAKKGQTPPMADNPLTSPDGNINIFVDSGTNIIAQWTAGTSSAPDYFSCRGDTCGVSVYNKQQIRDISFYPDRNDVIFFSTNRGVYAIEINPRDGTQNFQPVVENVSNPVFALDETQIFVSANGRITVSGI